MKTNQLLLAAGLFLIASCNNDKKEDVAKTDTVATVAAQPAAMPDSATMMKNWEAYMTPGDMHKMMADWNGTWNATINMWMAPGAPPSTSTGTSVNKMALGGRYQIGTFNGTYNGMPFEGMSTLAFDNAKKAFISSWIDNMGTGVMNMEGNWDPATKTIEMHGKMIDPSTGKETASHETFIVKDANTQVMQMFAPGADGKEFKTMEIIYTRKK